MKISIMAALAVAILTTPAAAGSSQHVAWGTKNSTDGNAPLDDHSTLAALAAAVNDGAGLTAAPTYNTITNYTCGTCISTSIQGDGNTVTTTGTTTGPVTGVQGIARQGGVKQVTNP